MSAKISNKINPKVNWNHYNKSKASRRDIAYDDSDSQDS